jgi:hypothetical protein
MYKHEPCNEGNGVSFVGVNISICLRGSLVVLACVLAHSNPACLRASRLFCTANIRAFRSSHFGGALA